MSKKNRPINLRRSEVDIALLTCGLVDLPIFQQCVDAIKREMESINSRCYVMMNGLTPETKEPFGQIVQTIPNVTVRHSVERVGFSTAANRIIKQATGTSQMVLFITDDVILHPGALAKLLETMKDPKIGMCGLKLVFPANSSDRARPAGRVQHIGHAIDIRGEVVHPLMGWSPDNPKCCKTRELQSVTGGVFIVRREAFLKAGGFFEAYGLGYFEDVDLCLTMRQIPNGVPDGGNYQVWINAEAIGTHVTNASMLKAGVPIPMQTNKFIFQQRHGRNMINDNWTFW